MGSGDGGKVGLVGERRRTEYKANSANRWLDETFELMPAALVFNKQSEDVTDKLLLELGDRSLIETVIIRAPMEGVGQDKSRRTICISTQVGCAYGCKFCASGLEGWKRLLAGH